MEDILEKALSWAQENYPDASRQHQCAFANSVQYLVTGASGGYGGPSIREHLVSWSLGNVGAIDVGGIAMTTVSQNKSLPYPGEWKFDVACKFAAPLCFEPVSKYKNILIQITEREYCFDDDADDLASLKS